MRATVRSSPEFPIVGEEFFVRGRKGWTSRHNMRDGESGFEPLSGFRFAT
jgi:hypothetical protein